MMVKLVTDMDRKIPARQRESEERKGSLQRASVFPERNAFKRSTVTVTVRILSYMWRPLHLGGRGKQSSVSSSPACSV